MMSFSNWTDGAKTQPSYYNNNNNNTQTIGHNMKNNHNLIKNRITKWKTFVIPSQEKMSNKAKKHTTKKTTIEFINH